MRWRRGSLIWNFSLVWLLVRLLWWALQKDSLPFELTTRRLWIEWTKDRERVKLRKKKIQETKSLTDHQHILYWACHAFGGFICCNFGKIQNKSFECSHDHKHMMMLYFLFFIDIVIIIAVTLLWFIVVFTYTEKNSEYEN